MRARPPALRAPTTLHWPTMVVYNISWEFLDIFCPFAHSSVHARVPYYVAGRLLTCFSIYGSRRLGCFLPLTAAAFQVLISILAAFAQSRELEREETIAQNKSHFCWPHLFEIQKRCYAAREWNTDMLTEEQQEQQLAIGCTLSSSDKDFSHNFRSWGQLIQI